MKYTSRNWTYIKLKQLGYNILLRKYHTGSRLILLDHNNEKIPLLGKLNDNEHRKTQQYLCQYINSQNVTNYTIEYAEAGSKIDLAMKEMIEAVGKVKRENIEYLLNQCLQEINKYTEESEKVSHLQMV